MPYRKCPIQMIVEIDGIVLNYEKMWKEWYLNSDYDLQLMKFQKFWIINDVWESVGDFKNVDLLQSFESLSSCR